MTDDKIALRELLEKGSDATFLREMIGFAAEIGRSQRSIVADKLSLLLNSHNLNLIVKIFKRGWVHWRVQQLAIVY